jgi:GMP synthase-like glutamine amidotransferase
MAWRLTMRGQGRAGLILQHSETGPPARLGEWLRERGIPFVVQRVWEERPPDPSGFSFVVSLGSKYSAAATDPAWIPHEIATLRAAVEHDVPVLGLCFGAQALSVALGGGTDPLTTPEIGWIAVESFDQSVPGGPWVQFHSEQMRIPPGARELARSPAGAAVFKRGRHVGVQFHPEADAALVDAWAQTHPELPDAGVTPADLASQSAAHAEGAREQAFHLFDNWIASALAPG